MKSDFRKSFLKDLKKIKNKKLLTQVAELIETLERSDSLQGITNIKQLSSDRNYFRIRMGDYRLGVKLENDVVIFVRFLHRKDIYRYFPFVT